MVGADCALPMLWAARIRVAIADSGIGIRQSFATSGSQHCNATVRAEVESALEHGIESVNALPEVAA
jgi:hypothetical protein